MAAGAVVGGAAGGAAGAETSALKVPTALSFLRPMPATDHRSVPSRGCNSQTNREGYNVRNTS